MTALTLAALILWPAPAPVDPPGVTGWASAYAPGVMESVITYRMAYDIWPHGAPPVDWYTVAGAIATNDCRQVGSVMTLTATGDGRAYRVLVADCAGDDGGADFMTRNNIVAELDWRLWSRLTETHGRPLKVTLR